LRGTTDRGGESDALVAQRKRRERIQATTVLSGLSGTFGDFAEALVTAGCIAPLVCVMTSVPRPDVCVTSIFVFVFVFLRAGVCDGGGDACLRQELGCVPPLVALRARSTGRQFREDAAVAQCNIVDDDDDASGSTAIAVAGGVRWLRCSPRGRLAAAWPPRCIV
jgi:hypothetical protein